MLNKSNPILKSLIITTIVMVLFLLAVAVAFAAIYLCLKLGWWTLPIVIFIIFFLNVFFKVYHDVKNGTFD